MTKNIAFVMGRDFLMSSWKKLRSELTSQLTDHDYMNKVVEFWSMAPTQDHVMSVNDTSTWVNPWSLIHQGEFDLDTISLAMFYTINLANVVRWNIKDIELVLLNDPHKNQLAVLINKTHLLGWEYNNIVDFTNISKSVTVEHSYYYHPETNIVQLY